MTPIEPKLVQLNMAYDSPASTSERMLTLWFADDDHAEVIATGPGNIAVIQYHTPQPGKEEKKQMAMDIGTKFQSWLRGGAL